MDVIQTLRNCQLELRQMHNHIGISDKGKLDYVPCTGGCPTLTYADQCSVAIGEITTVIDRLEAWRDNAALMLKQAKPEDEAQWINQKRNYEALITLLKG